MEDLREDRPGAARAPRGRVLAVPRAVALAAIAVLVAAASVAAFAESYRGLYDWAAGHGLTGAWAVIWPLQVDVFIAVGELALFVALVDRWERRSRVAAWAVTVAGLAVSVAGNVGHAAGRSLTVHATAAVPPLAAALALAVALGVLKRVVEAQHAESAGPVPVAVPAAPAARGRLPSVREIRDRRNCSQATAEKIRQELAAFERGRGGAQSKHPAAAPATSSGPPAGGARPDPPAGAAIPRAPSPAGASNGQVRP